MRNRSIAQIILIPFLKTIGVIFLLLGVGVLSYYLTITFLKKTARVERSTQYEHVMDINTGNESSNLIYSFDDKTNRIEAMVLELFDSGTKNLTYITIPVNTQVTISGKNYQNLLEKSGKLPQVVMMSKLNEYFSGDVAYEYGILILQEAYKADIGYFTALKSSEFKKCFERETGKKIIYRPTKVLLDEAAQCKDEETMNDLIERKWDTLISNITLSQKQRYAKDLIQVKRDLIYTHQAFGQESSGAFQLNKQKNQEFVNGIWEKKSYAKPQGKSAVKPKDASGTTVFIYNGSKITGLAAKYQKKLEEAGFIVKGIDNATGDLCKTTTIYTSKKKTGEKFEKYFKSPVLKLTSKLGSGADVEIVLGTNDDLS